MSLMSSSRMVDGVLSAAHVLLSLSGNQTNSTSLASARAATVISWLTFIMGLPALGVAIYTLRKLSKGERKVPPHITLLLVSDIFSFLGRPAVNQSSAESSPPTLSSSFSFSSDITDLIFYFGLISNIYLMLFISQERHLAVSFPQCVNSSCAASQFVVTLKWIVPFGVLALVILRYMFWFAVALLVPFPFLLFFALDSWRALVFSLEPWHVREKKNALKVWGDVVEYVSLVSRLLLYLGPMVDPFLYIFITQGPREVLKTLPCCNSAQTEPREQAVHTVAQAVDTRL
ncbi:hypothetical protein WMY93_017900 [Mugilogobius chulae]|uniref:G-protein coupled receptors family 1 profile domain-containing protein n=1 Tax=Mugilogobius chulae TaxID=88201 RepID=A0AAW0NHJ6_9GOBI